METGVNPWEILDVIMVKNCMASKGRLQSA